MKRQKTNKDDELLFNNFIKGGDRVTPQLPLNFENRVMQQIHERNDAGRSSFLSRFRMPSMRILAPASALMVLLLIGTLFFTRQVSVTEPCDIFRTVSFRFKDSAASRVCLVGDFNSWKKNSDCLLKKNGYWHIQKQLKAGQFYKYAFFVNNKQIVRDLRAAQFVEDGFGGQTAVVYVN